MNPKTSLIQTRRPILSSLIGLALLPIASISAYEVVIPIQDVSAWDRGSGSADGTGDGGILRITTDFFNMDKVDPVAPSTWLDGVVWPADFQGQEIGSLTDNGWIVFDLGASHPTISNMYIWNVSENTGSNRGIQDYNLYYATDLTTNPLTVSAGSANLTDGAANVVDYDFQGGGWTLQSSGTIDQGGTLNNPPDELIDVSGIPSTARYIGIEVVNNYGDTGRTGLGQVVFSTPVDTMTWLGGTNNWSNGASWNPGVLSGADVIIDVASSTVTVDSAVSALRVTVGENNTSSLIVSSGNSLTVTDDSSYSLGVGTSGSLTVDGTLVAPTLISAGTTVIDPAADVSGVALTSLTGGTLTSSSALTLDGLEMSGGTLTTGGDLTLDTFTYSGGTLSVSGTLSALTAVTVTDAALALPSSISTQTFTLDGGSVTGGVIDASALYSFTNVADYGDDLTGASADLIIGAERLTDETVKLSGTGNTYGGTTTINRGFLSVSANAANLGAGRLVFDATANQKQPAVLQTSGTFNRTIGTGLGEVDWNNDGGFAATDSPLTVSLTPAGGAAGDPLNWGDATMGFSSKRLQLGAATSTAAITITNDITLGDNRSLDLFDNPASSADISILSGNIDDSGTSRSLKLYGEGTLWLQGANDLGSGTIDLTGNTILRAVEGVGLPNGAKLYFNSSFSDKAILESSGSFTRSIANSAGSVYWNGNGGFAASGGPLTVNLNAGATIDWQATAGFRSRNLVLGSPSADNVVTLQNNIDIKGTERVYVYDNADTTTDYAVMSGIIANGDVSIRRMDLYGGGKLVLTGANTHTGGMEIRDGSTLIINGTQSAATGLVRGFSPGVLGGAGTLGGDVDIEGGAALTFDLSTSAGSHTPLTVQGAGGLEFKGSSTLTITTSGGASPGTYTLVSTTTGVVGGSGGVPGTVILPAGWTADAPVIDGSDNLVINITSTGGGVSDPYGDWATGGELFEDDKNGDGVKNGLAFLLGAANPDADATDLLPTVSEDGSGNLIMQFNCLPAADRGTAQLRVAHSNTLAGWTLTTDVVPDATGADVGGVVSYVVGAGPAGPPATNTVTATIDSSAAAGGKLFGRVNASE